jgi:uncharacterized membrane protein (UPF0127 family)
MWFPVYPSFNFFQRRDLTPLSSFISESPIVAKIQYWMKITFVFILILFIDSVNRVYRVQVELGLTSENAKNKYEPPFHIPPGPYRGK